MTWTQTVCTVKHGSPGDEPHHQLHPSLQTDTLSPSPPSNHYIILSLPLLSITPSSILTQHRPRQTSGLSAGPANCVAQHSSEPWMERLQKQPQLSLSSSAAAEEFPARVLQQIVSHRLRCLRKYPSSCRKKRREQTPALWMHLLSLSVSYLLLVNMFWWETGEAPLYKLYRKLGVCFLYHRWSGNACHPFSSHITQYLFSFATRLGSHSEETPFLSFQIPTWKISFQSRAACAFDCYLTARSTVTHGALFSSEHKQTLAAWVHVYIHKPLGCYCPVCLATNTVGRIHKKKNHMARSFFYRHLIQTHISSHVQIDTASFFSFFFLPPSK